MDFGIFLEQTRRGVDQPDAFREMFAMAEAGEAWALDIVWLAEMPFNPARSVLSGPLLMASWIASRTKRIRTGTAVQLLPLNHPLRLAGEVTTLDHLSQGRFDFGIGRSGGTRGYDALGIPYAESQERFFEALDIIVTAWKGEPFSYEGKFYQFENVAVAPRPYRSSPPPLRMAATTPDTFPRVARLGLPIFVGLRGMSIPELAGHLKTYRAAWRDAGHPGDGDVCLRIPLYAAPTAEAAVEEPKETITFYFQRQAALTVAPVGRAGIPAELRRNQPHLRRDPQHQGRVRHCVTADRPARRAEGRTRIERHRGRAEPWRPSAVRARAPQPRDHDTPGDARVQIGACEAGSE